MNSIDEILPTLKVIISGLAKHFGDNCEFVIHDYSKEFSSTIVAIENGDVTGRKVGGGGTGFGLKIMQGTQNEDGRYCYTTQTEDGRRLRSSTIYLKNDADKTIGTLCINYDITDAVNARSFLDNFLFATLQEPIHVEKTVFQSVDDLLIAMIKESINGIGVTVASMTREQKMEGIKFLKKKGAFKIKNAVNIVAKYYHVSRYTIYNYINE